ncbi:hypothetical protein BGZ94_003776 [Podila epigama]|nr:hypothetical protein BGZ94_003776 [Podila epigama]
MDRLCRDYMKGECKRRYGCKFVHDPITDLARKIVGHPGWYGSAGHPFEEFIVIKYVGRFEAFGSYENWGQGWQVTLKAIEKGPQSELFRLQNPIVVEHKELYKALQQLYELAEPLKK